MAHYIEDKRNATFFVMGSLETLLPMDSIARTIHAALKDMDFSLFDARYKNDEGGRPALGPRALTGVWLLALIQGITSTVRLAGLCREIIEYRWLLGDAHVEKSTLCSFRKTHLAEITALCAQVLVALGQNNLLPGVNVGVDGTIIRAASSRHSSKKRGSLERQVAKVENLLRERLSDDQDASAQEDVIELESKIRKLKETLKQMDEMNLMDKDDRITTTEPEAKLLKQKDGSFSPSYCVQAPVDLDSGVLIVANQNDEGSDAGQLLPQKKNAQVVLKQTQLALDQIQLDLDLIPQVPEQYPFTGFFNTPVARKDLL